MPVRTQHKAASMSMACTAVRGQRDPILHCKRHGRSGEFRAGIANVRSQRRIWGCFQPYTGAKAHVTHCKKGGKPAQSHIAPTSAEEQLLSVIQIMQVGGFETR